MARRHFFAKLRHPSPHPRREQPAAQRILVASQPALCPRPAHNHLQRHTLGAVPNLNSCSSSVRRRAVQGLPLAACTYLALEACVLKFAQEFLPWVEDSRVISALAPDAGSAVRRSAARTSSAGSVVAAAADGTSQLCELRVGFGPFTERWVHALRRAVRVISFARQIHVACHGVPHTRRRHRGQSHCWRQVRLCLLPMPLPRSAPPHALQLRVLAAR